MPKITVLARPEAAQERVEFEVAPGTNLCDALLEHDVDIEHACGKVGACTTCHVVIREGFDSLNETSDEEEDMLDRAWGLEAGSRLSCQVLLSEEPVVVELPRYTINHAKENG
jgi:2Fe-2S ferredoxin